MDSLVEDPRLLPVLGPGQGPTFACTSCGKCCDTLKEREGAPEWPTSFEALARVGLYGLRTERGLQVWAWERERMAAEAAARGVTLRFLPSLVALDDSLDLGRVVVLVYELDHVRCPFLVAGAEPETFLCSAYSARPTVCRAFPVLVRGGEGAYSLKCPVTFAPEGPGRIGFLEAYGEAFLAAEHGGSVSREARRLLEALESAGTLALRREAGREEVARRVARGPLIDFWDVVANSGSEDPDDWLRRIAPPPPPAPALAAAAGGGDGLAGA